VVVELLSPGTEDEDLGHTPAPRTTDQPPTKWMVYEQILAIPYYVVYSRYTDTVQYFVLHQGRYQAVHPPDQRLWLPEAGLGLGLWSGAYQEIAGPWLRCYNAQGAWIPTPAERAEHAQQQAQHAQQQAQHAQHRAERLAAQLRALGIEPEV
ncbi:MAG: Uma2 family endonuclease, partial [Candidatus Tectomicrobia bacterium]|nr:Uma2 family endonuclease [Candidatus Tectomicrobia bacterium]